MVRVRRISNKGYLLVSVLSLVSLMLVAIEFWNGLERLLGLQLKLLAWYNFKSYDIFLIKIILPKHNYGKA